MLLRNTGYRFGFNGPVQRQRPSAEALRLAASLCLALAGALLPTQVLAQRFEFAQQRGPYYVGEPMVVQVTATGFPPGQEPVCSLADRLPDGLTIQGPQVGRSESSVIQSINGRITRQESVTYTFTFAVTASREGEYAIGPFAVEFDGSRETIEGASVRFGKLANDEDMQIELSLPQDTIYVGQQIPLTIRWAFAGDVQAVQHAFNNLRIRSPIFDQFSFQDKRPSSRTRLTLSTAAGDLEVDAEVTQEQREGREFIVVTGKRTMIADAVGEYESIPVTCRTSKVTSWGRNIFGDPRPRSTQPSLAAGEPLSFIIKPVPEEGKPDSFSGAVGTGFSIGVTADRTVVRVGDPISLDVTIGGEGNMRQLSLPPLSADGGLQEELFQLPQDKPAGTMVGNAKQFKLSVRVKDESVTQIPAIAFSWFDPSQEAYLTARSKPIAMQVVQGPVVSSADVVSAPKQVTSQDPDAVSPPQDTPRVTFVGANLAIEKDRDKLQSASAGGGIRGLAQPAFYGLGIAALLAAVVIRRRGNADPEIAARKMRFKASLQQIASARSLPDRQAAERVADALRKIRSQCPSADRDQVDAIVAQCESRVYAPADTDQDDFAEQIVPRALEAANNLVANP